MGQSNSDTQDPGWGVTIFLGLLFLGSFFLCIGGVILVWRDSDNKAAAQAAVLTPPAIVSSPDETFLAVSQCSGTYSSSDICLIKEKDGQVFAQSLPFQGQQFNVVSDGTWMVFLSNHSGDVHVYIAPVGDLKQMKRVDNLPSRAAFFSYFGGKTVYFAQTLFQQGIDLSGQWFAYDVQTEQITPVAEMSNTFLAPAQQDVPGGSKYIFTSPDGDILEVYAPNKEIPTNGQAFLKGAVIRWPEGAWVNPYPIWTADKDTVFFNPANVPYKVTGVYMLKAGQVSFVNLNYQRVDQVVSTVRLASPSPLSNQ
jgi:hypothetical protein